MSAFLVFVSAVFGWIYTFCWSLSFYPQPVLNRRRKATSGTTIDFPLLNVVGASPPLPSYRLLFSCLS